MMNPQNKMAPPTPQGMGLGGMRSSGSSGKMIILVIAILIVAGGAGAWYFLAGDMGGDRGVGYPSQNGTLSTPQTSQTPVSGGQTASDPAVESIANVTSETSVSAISQDLDETDFTSVDMELDAIDKELQSAE